MKEIRVNIEHGENFTPADLMKRYADQTPGVTFQWGHWHSAELIIEGQRYGYHHWAITADKGQTYVKLYLERWGEA